MLTQERLKRLLDYDPAMGKFLWLEDRSNVIRAGMTAGSLTASGYITIQVDGRPYRASHLAHLWMTGRHPVPWCDHEDGDTQNDRWLNLREATPAQNGKNRKMNKNNQIGLKGVHAYKGKFKAQIQVDGRKIHLGTFDRPDLAFAAYIAAAREHHGAFARY
jgi:hypothetical protein